MRLTELQVGRRRQMLVIVAAVAIAYFPTLFCGFVYDDHRFVENNDAVSHLSPRNFVRYFSDPKTLAEYGYKGIYRPLRTLDFAVDWAVSGGGSWFFHLRNVLYHALGAILLLLLLRELAAAREHGDAEAFAGALFFALHPVNTEVVAWVTSRGDLHVFILVMLGLYLHVRGRHVATALVMVPMLLAKESAVVFAGAALLCDYVRGERLRFRWYAVYGAIAGVYTLLWWKFLAHGQSDGMGHLPYYWGGSYGANLLTMSQGYLLYFKQMILPSDLIIDYHVPSISRFTPGAIVSILGVLGIAIAAVLGGRRSRFALLWFFVLLFPVSNLLIKIGIPTAERFLYLPLVGLAFLIAPLMARSRWAIVLLLCFGGLTFMRTFDWRSDDALFSAADRVAPTPRGLAHRVAYEIAQTVDLREKIKRGGGSPPPEMRERLRRHALNAVAACDELLDLYRNWIGLDPGDIGGSSLALKANALVQLGRYEDALEAADQSIRMMDGHPDPKAFYNAALALMNLERYEEAALNLEAAKENGYRMSDLTEKIAHMWYAAGAKAASVGDFKNADRLFRRSWKVLPDPVRNARTLQALR